MYKLTLVALIMASLSSQPSAQSKEGSLCVAPAKLTPAPATAATPALVCESGRLLLKIDTTDPVPWPQDTSLKIGHLDFSQRHKVTILCDDKAQQSFPFRFATFKADELCLFLNDRYQTAQLWEPKRAPWCKCVRTP